MSTKRTDKFSPSNLNPNDFRFLLFFYNGVGAGLWPIHNDLIMGLRQERGNDFANIHGGNYNCDVCGQSYNTGEAWECIETGEIITLGHQCAESYNLLADDPDFERLKANGIRARKRFDDRCQKRAMLREVLSENPGLYDAFKTDHYIVQDIRSRLIQWGNVSEKQVELVFKIQQQEKDKVENIEDWVPAPVTDGRVEVTATILAAKTQEDAYGYSYKAFLKVHADDGDYKSWGTIPDGNWPKQEENEAGVSGQDITLGEMKGRKVKFFARFTVAKDDPTMTFYKRPTKWVWVS